MSNSCEICGKYLGQPLSKYCYKCYNEPTEEAIDSHPLVVELRREIERLSVGNESVLLEIQREIASEWHSDYINGRMDYDNPFDTWGGVVGTNGLKG